MVNTPTLRRKGFLQRWKGPSRKSARHPLWVPDPDRYMPAATRTRWPTGNTANPWLYGTGLAYQCSKLFFGSPDYPTNNFLITFVGFALTEGGNAPQETQAPPNDTFIDEAYFIHPNGTEYPIDFLGNAAATVTTNTGVVHGTVTLPEDLPGWSVFGVKTFYHGVEGAARLGCYRIQRHRGEKFWGAADLASVKALATANAVSTAALDPDTWYNTVGNATNSQQQAYGPSLICAKGWDGRPAPIVIGDSLIERQEIAASADERGNMGMIRRWLDKRDDTYGSYIPIVMGVPGAHNEYELGTNATKRWDMIDAIAVGWNNGKPIWTSILDQGGRNDTHSTSSATWLSRKYQADTRVVTRYPDQTGKLVGMTILPTMASTSNVGFTTAGYGATAAQWNGVTGVLAAVNSAIKASSRFKAVLDAYTAYVSDVDPTKAAGGADMPLGNVVGHPGNQDGVTNWNTMVLPDTVPLGSTILFEYQPGLYARRTVDEIVSNNGDGTMTVRVHESFATIVQDNAALYGAPFTASGLIHPALHAILRFVSRFSQSGKLYLHV
ncbi:hypothetical protein EVB84_048 [Rhizobium phage RHph_Y48]|nr:hypothetical protein EVB84_048 [Rhizobium phage RHph_Y48]